MCGGCSGCSDKPVDFTAVRINYDSNKSAEMMVPFAGCRSVEIRNLGTAKLVVGGVEVEPESYRGFCPPGGGYFAKNKAIKFTPESGTKILEIVYFREVKEDCPPINESK